MKKIFITGGAGFIGSAIVKEFSKEEHDILVYDNLSFGKNKYSNYENVRLVVGNILDADKLVSHMQEYKPDYIIHLAAIHFIPYCNQNPFESANINILGTMNVIEAIKKYNCAEKIFFASTAAVYPICDAKIPESLNPVPSDIYGLSKLAGEQLFKKLFQEIKIPTIICRFFNAFGPNETNPHLIPEILAQILNGSDIVRLGNILPKRDFIHTQDMALAICLLFKAFTVGYETFNLGHGKEYSALEVVNAFESAIGRKVAIEVNDEKIRKVDRLHLLADVTKLKHFINWEPKITLNEGIKRLIESSNIN